MRYIVLDLEWNISPPRSRRAGDKNPQTQLNEEIIEIGAYSLDEDFNILDRFSTNVKARFNKKIHKHVALVTQRTEESLQTGLDFPDAIAAFKEWCTNGSDMDILFCTWSNNDVKPWVNNFKAYNLEWTSGMRFMDIQRLFGRTLETKQRNQISISTALELLNIDQELVLHKAVNDAYYAARIFKNTIAKLRTEEIFSVEAEDCFKMLYKYAYDISMNYRDKFELDGIKEIKELPGRANEHEWLCPACKEKLTKTKFWRISKGGHKLTADACCDEHEKVLISAVAYKTRSINEMKPKLFKIKAEAKIAYAY